MTTWPNQVTSVTVTAGGPTVHVTLINETTGAALSPVGWAISSLNPTNATVTIDSGATPVGFNVAGLTVGVYSAVFTGPGGLTASLGINVIEPFTVGFTSP